LLSTEEGKGNMKNGGERGAKFALGRRFGQEVTSADPSIWGRMRYKGRERQSVNELAKGLRGKEFG